MSAPRRALVLQAVGAGLLFLLLIGLGVWQLRRMDWKEALIARIEARVHAEPDDLPPRGEWGRVAAEQYEYRRVRARGRLEADREVLAFSAAPKGGGDEPGYYVIAPLDLASGGVVLVNRGFLRQSRRADAAGRRAPPGEVALTGVLRAPQSRNIFTPADDPAKGVWYTRDPAKIAAHLALVDAAPFILDQDAAAQPADAPDGLFRAAIEVSDIPNNHLSYALTWFALAAALAAMFAVYAAGALRRPRLPGE